MSDNETDDWQSYNEYIFDHQEEYYVEKSEIEKLKDFIKSNKSSSV